MKDQFYIYLDTMPTATSQQKGISVRGGEVHFYKKKKVSAPSTLFKLKLRQHKPKRLYEGNVRLYLIFAFDVKDKSLWGKYKPTRPDVDNIAKEFVDCMRKVFFADDNQVVDLRIVKVYAEKASIMVRIEELGDRP